MSICRHWQSWAACSATPKRRDARSVLTSVGPGCITRSTTVTTSSGAARATASADWTMSLTRPRPHQGRLCAPSVRGRARGHPPWSPTGLRRAMNVQSIRPGAGRRRFDERTSERAWRNLCVKEPRPPAARAIAVQNADGEDADGGRFAGRDSLAGSAVRRGLVRLVAQSRCAEKVPGLPPPVLALSVGQGQEQNE
jgi:hypothetical protein